MSKFRESLFTILYLLPFAAICFFGLSATHHAERRYVIHGTVTAIEADSDTVVFENAADGNIWAFYGQDGWTIGDSVCAVMSDNATSDITTDDIVISVQEDHPWR